MGVGDAGESGDAEEAGGDDDLAGLTFDDDFVRRASVHEAAADERLERMRRIDAEYRRLLDERRAQFQAPLAQPAARRARRRTRLGVALVVMAVAGLIGWSMLFEEVGGGPGTADIAGVDPVDTSDAPASGDVDTAEPVSPAEPVDTVVGGDLVGGEVARPTQPSPSAEQQPTPLGTPAPVAVESPAHRFLALQPDASGPIAYDPCRPIHVVVNTRTASAGADTLLTEALAEVSRVTGLQFAVDGPTDERPDAEREPFQPDRYGDRWAPVLVAWSDPGEVADLGGDIAGTGGSTWLELPRRASAYVTGAVTLDGPQIAEILQQPTGHEQARAIIQHELAHLLGLDHVDDPAELMHPVGRPEVVAFGPGDLTGLAELGQGECFPDI